MANIFCDDFTGTAEGDWAIAGSGISVVGDVLRYSGTLLAKYTYTPPSPSAVAPNVFRVRARLVSNTGGDFETIESLSTSGFAACVFAGPTSIWADGWTGWKVGSPDALSGDFFGVDYTVGDWVDLRFEVSGAASPFDAELFVDGVSVRTWTAATTSDPLNAVLSQNVGAGTSPTRVVEWDGFRYGTTSISTGPCGGGSSEPGATDSTQGCDLTRLQAECYTNPQSTTVDVTADPSAEAGFAANESQIAVTVNLLNGDSPATLTLASATQAFAKSGAYRFRINYRADAVDYTSGLAVHLEVREKETEDLSYGAYFDIDDTVNDNVYKQATLASGATPYIDPETEYVTITGDWGEGQTATSRQLFIDWVEVEFVCGSEGATPAGSLCADTFADASEIKGVCGTRTCANSEATSEEVEPFHAGVAPNHSVWFKWQCPAAVTDALFNTFGSAIDTVLAVYQNDDGTETSSLADLTEVTSNDDDPFNSPHAAVSFTATPADWYYIAVDSQDADDTGNFVLNWGTPSLYHSQSAADVNTDNTNAAVVGDDVRDWQQHATWPGVVDTLRSWTTSERVLLTPTATIRSYGSSPGDIYQFSWEINAELMQTIAWVWDGTDDYDTLIFDPIEALAGDRISFQAWQIPGDADGAAVVKTVTYTAARIECAGGGTGGTGNPCDPDAPEPCPDDPCLSCGPASSTGASADCPPPGSFSCDAITNGVQERTYYATIYAKVPSWQQWREGVDEAQIAWFVLRGHETDPIDTDAVWVGLRKGFLIGAFDDSAGSQIDEPFSPGIEHCIEFSMFVGSDGTVTQEVWLDGVPIGTGTSAAPFTFDGYANVPGPLPSFPVRFCSGLVGTGNTAIQVELDGASWSDAARIGCGQDVGRCDDPCDPNCDAYDPADPRCAHCDSPCNPECPTYQSEDQVITADGTVSGGTYRLRYSPPVPVAHELLLAGAPAGGTFSLRFTFDSTLRLTDPIPFDATAAEVQTALTDVGAPVTVSGPDLPAGPLLIEWTLPAGETLPDLTYTNSLTGGSTPQPVVTQTLSTSALNYNDAAGTIQTALEAIVGAGQVSVTGGALPATPVTVSWIGTLLGTRVEPLQTVSALTGGGSYTVTGQATPECEGCTDPCNPNCGNYDAALAADCSGPCGGNPCNDLCGGDSTTDGCEGCEDPCNPNCRGVYDPTLPECVDGCQDPCDPACPTYDPDADCPGNEPPGDSTGTLAIGWVNPLDGDEVSGVVTLEVDATATEPQSVTGVKFFRTTGTVTVELGDAQGSEPYTFEWTTSTLAIGAHTLTATAYGQDQASISASIDITVADIDPPVVTFLSPTESTVSGLVPIAVEVLDNDVVESVSYVLDPDGVAYEIGTATLGPPWLVMLNLNDVECEVETTTNVTLADDWEDAITLEGSCGSVRGSNIGFSLQMDEPPAVSGPGGRSAWYGWVATFTGSMTFTTRGSTKPDESDFDTVLTVYTGASLATLVFEDFDDDNGFDPPFSSLLAMDVVEDTQYWISVDGFDDTQEGDVVLTWYPTPQEHVIRATATDASGNEGTADQGFTIGQAPLPPLAPEAFASWPDGGLLVQIDFVNDPSSESELWENVSSYVTAASITRGRGSELERADTGELTLTLRNTDRRFEPYFSGSPYYPNVVPMRRVRAIAVDREGDDHTLFTGFIESWPQTYTLRHGFTEVTAVDALFPIRQSEFSANLPRELTGSRIGRVLDLVGWPAARRDLDEGKLQVRLETLLSTQAGETNESFDALPHLQEVAASELGLVFCTRSGEVAFHDRDHRASAERSVVSQATFGDGGLSSGELPYTSPEIDFNVNRVYNDIHVTREGEAEQTAEDTDSQARYWKRTLRENVLLASAAGALQHARSLLSYYKEPQLKLDTLSMNPMRHPAYWAAVLPLEISDRVTVVRRPAGGSSIRLASWVERIEHDIQSSGTRRTWTIRLTLSQPPPPTGAELTPL